MSLSDLSAVAAPAVLVALACGASTALLAAVSYPLLRARLLSAAPVARADVLFALASAPVVLAMSVAAASFLPSILTWLSLQSDHCAQDLHDHLHLCLLHPPPVTTGAQLWVVPGAVGAILLGGMARELGRGLRTRRALAPLAATSTPDTARGVRWLSSSVPLAVAVGGARRGAVIVASSLRERLAPRELESVIEHERAHLRRRDGAWRTIAAVLAVAHVPSLRRTLIADLALACEEACDDEAVEAVGDRLSVASALVAVSRLWSERVLATAVAAPAFTGADVATRVARLLDEPRQAGAWLPRARTWLGSIGALAAGSGREIHHLTETLASKLL